MTSEPAIKEFCPVVDTTEEEVEREVAQYAHYRKLSTQEILALTQRFIDCTDPEEKEKLREEIFRGWYGGVEGA